MKAKTVLITGATSGIGKATAKKFAKAGYNLIITGRRKEKLEQYAEKLATKYVVKVLPLAFDLRKVSEVKKAIKSLGKSWVKIDILINNAGLAKGFDPIHEGHIEDWELMIDTNLKGLLYMTRMIAPKMVKAKSGHIINVASTAGKEVYPNGNVYCASKHAVDALTKAMRIDLYKHGIRVGQVAPGHVESTEFALVRFDGDREKSKIYDDFVPTNSKDIANVIYFMASQPAHVNIQDILVMGTQQASSLFINRSGRN
jgi:NADP-dependent 3-hydroxy acid dehydrogenase YdfG